MSDTEKVSAAEVASQDSTNTGNTVAAGGAVAPPAVEIAVAAPATVDYKFGDIEIKVKIGKWGSRVRYECPLCPFDTLDSPDPVFDHCLRLHYQSQQMEPSLLFDHNGKKL